MNLLKQTTKNIKEHTKALAKGLLIALLTGIAGGFTGSLFHVCIDLVTQLRTENTWIIYFLPIGALCVMSLYAIFKKSAPMDTDRVFDSVRGDKKVPLPMLPLIFTGSALSHLVGASVGREGAALQLGGSCGYGIGRLFHLKPTGIRIAVMSGMSAVFTALFGTPVAASVFALEVTLVGSMHYGALFPCVLSSAVAFGISTALGIAPVRFAPVLCDMSSPVFVVRIIVLSILCAFLSIVFCKTIATMEKGAKRLVPNKYLRAFLGGALVLGLTWSFDTYDYNGAGMHIITKALEGEASYEAFILKIMFTAVSLAAGFKGGEIVPAFFVGSAFGCVAAPVIGMDASIGAAIGFIALFCGVVNCPLASVFLAAEIFGTDSILMFCLVCAVSYMMSGKSGLYKSQSILYSKLDID